ncbi:hypothetical protein [Actinophytocola glycyrrhizae]|uniref:Uncharacterized protein n=1 Tax=Actinophytocola glycyrrhizae TaxID=2044873 RepID=A0ABV9S2D7_9PSEU
METVGTFTRQSLKSSLGEDDWLRFFALMGSEIARLEGTPIVPGTPESKDEHVEELVLMTKKLAVIERLSVYGAALDSQVINPNEGRYFLLTLNIPGNSSQ